VLRAHRDEILRIPECRGVSNVRVFGSVARGDVTPDSDAMPDSDVDLLVEFETGHRGLDLFGFAREMEELIGTGSISEPGCVKRCARRSRPRP
jgi:predicted nucleotidyltransferase